MYTELLDKIKISFTSENYSEVFNLLKNIVFSIDQELSSENPFIDHVYVEHTMDSKESVLLSLRDICFQLLTSPHTLSESISSLEEIQPYVASYEL